ncbi:nuclear transport factor 2 family protein [Nocardia carnea]|uniref:nuclear transport factor 2 family protein n=1 Tax=Nocardia carnea TaxID=37328 RepID=UPI002457B4D4|nr:nuclear transport factor 2 family protein [Nocardia carnea]
MADSPVLTTWRTGDTDSLAEILAPDAVFSSPVADYRGRPAVLHMLGLISQVLHEPGAVRRWSRDHDTVYRFRAHVAGAEVQGMLHEERDEAGRLVHITLFLRPYSSLREAIRAMARLLEQSPLDEPPA